MKSGLAGLLLLWYSVAGGQSVHHFTFGKNQFLLDGQPFQIISGEMHPARIPKEYWRHRIRMARAMGCNTIAVYVFWNYHEPVEGQFDFASENRNIAEFIRICQEEKMWVLLRPGPYVCAEWDFGGLPAWLLKTPDIRIRCMDTHYMAAVKEYVHHLSKEISSLQCSHGGPILMVQVENEYGSYGNDRTYLETLRQWWQEDGIDIPFYTADGPTAFMLEAGNIDGAAIGLDSGSSEEDFQQATKRNPDVPAFSSETYPGWLTHWKEKFARPDTADLKKEVEFLLRTERSFNLYVIHGGTNFGFTAGANAFSPTQFQPDITSYDYDAPIDEQGNPTPKYFMLRDLIEKYTHRKPPAVPDPVPSMEIPEIRMSAANSIFNLLPDPLRSPQPIPMEALGQNQGLVLYRTKLIGHHSGKLTITEPHDFALVFLDGRLIDTVYRDGGKWTVTLPPSGNSEPVLEILVEAMGHINFAQYMIDRKGITDHVTLNGMTLMNWEIFSLPMDSHMFSEGAQHPAGMDIHDQGLFFTGHFSLSQTADTYFDLSNYKKGIVCVNGHNLGRYWRVGPQQRLYCPGVWLKKGDNEIVVFDLQQESAASITGRKTLE